MLKVVEVEAKEPQDGRADEDSFRRHSRLTGSLVLL